MIGSSFAALSGVLIAPSLGLHPLLLTLLVVQAFGAAALGHFDSLGRTYVGGLAVGVVAAVATKYVGARPALVGFPSAVPFLVLFGVLLVSKPQRFRDAGGRLGSLADAGRRAQLPRSLTRIGWGLAAVMALVVPFVVGTKLILFIHAVAFVPLFVSLALLLRASGQVSLCHAAFAAVGAAAFSHFTVDMGIPWLPALLLAGLVATPIGALIAVPAIRLSGLYLALATLGFGLLAERLLFRTSLMFGAVGSRSASRPVLPGISTDSERGYYFVVLIVTVAACILVALILRSRLGRLFRAMSDAPLALTTYGLNVAVTRLIVFCIAAFLAAISGALFVAETGQINLLPFTPTNSLLWLAVLVIAGRSVIGAGFVAPALLVLLPAYMPEALIEYQPLAFGLLAMGVAVFGEGRLGARWLRARFPALELPRAGTGPLSDRRPRRFLSRAA
jgi:ABC-type branched-subunit amino acid transport system permease subunit